MLAEEGAVVLAEDRVAGLERLDVVGGVADECTVVLDGYTVERVVGEGVAVLVGRVGVVTDEVV